MLMQENRQEPAQELVGRVFRVVEEFSASIRQTDDMTVMVIRRTH